MKPVVKWSELSDVLEPSDLGIKDGFRIVSVNLEKRRAVVEKDGEYYFVGLTHEDMKLIHKALRGKEGT